MSTIWDPKKAKANLHKHGIRFSDAEGVPFDPNALSQEDPIYRGEQRFAAVGGDAFGRILVMPSAGFWWWCTPIAVTTSGLFQPGALRAEREHTMRKEYDFSHGRRGAVLPQTGKTRITIYLDDEILEEFRGRADSAGRGYQTMINDALKEYLGKSRRPVDAQTLRRILREELRRTG